MIDIRKFATLGSANHGWLDARHHFSFADYHDPDRVQWGNIRVWNDDTIAPHSGFPPHPHSSMEIVTYVRNGAISHRDNMGNSGRTQAGDVQVMSAGSGIVHSEYNLEDEPTDLFQIWIMPDRQGGAPTWGTRPFPQSDRAGQFVPLASGIAGDDALPIRADARVSGATLKAGEAAEYHTDKSRHLYLVPATGTVEVNGKRLCARDGAAITGEDVIVVRALEDSELVLVDAA
ncbi:pirin family protein [Novosphingobium sp.]|uniref:pirin family protein n=1 Tax=Novosphingobium sp. TaxID=1874826 RepID=UPI0025D1E527|nr:pirin family protein [Novosphingobium sp.]